MNGMRQREDRIAGVLMGTAIGDALGLPAEGLRPAQIRAWGWTGNWKHRFLGRRGMWSDDTEHTIMLGQALLASGGNSQRFGREFARELRWWLLGMPAGVGLATLRSTLKLWLGFSPHRSGVFSAGNGPCMRTALIGACFPEDPHRRRALVEAHTRMTHTDPKALIAARAVTELASLLIVAADSPPSWNGVLQMLTFDGGAVESDWEAILSEMAAGWIKEIPMGEFLRQIGADPERGISGYAWHTVPAVIYSGVRNGWKARETITELLDAGGDTDTVGAIAGALCGAFGGKGGFPADWRECVAEWPTQMGDLSRLAEALSDEKPRRIRPRWSLRLLVRNLFFLLVVLGHGFSRPLRSFFGFGSGTNSTFSQNERHQTQ